MGGEGERRTEIANSRGGRGVKTGRVPGGEGEGGCFVAWAVGGLGSATTGGSRRSRLVRIVVDDARQGRRRRIDGERRRHRTGGGGGGGGGAPAGRVGGGDGADLVPRLAPFHEFVDGLPARAGLAYLPGGGRREVVRRPDASLLRQLFIDEEDTGGGGDGTTQEGGDYGIREGAIDVGGTIRSGEGEARQERGGGGIRERNRRGAEEEAQSRLARSWSTRGTRSSSP